MSADPKIKVRILIMDRHFLYLPLYFAAFDHPPAKKKAFFGQIPDRYELEIKTLPPTGPRSDGAVYNALMDSRLGSSDLMFGVCDPSTLIARPEKHARIAASLISSSAFWAVNHEAQNLRLVSDLSSFKKIICYGEKTTSNLIARRIVKRDTDKLMVVESTKEIDALRQLGEGTLAISPELLHIANLIHGPLKEGEKRHEIVLELSTSKEFSNVLTTAIFTRAEVVDRYPDLVQGLLAALQRSLMAIYAGHPLVSTCAESNFRDTYCLDEALNLARSSNVFPETIHVRRDRWLRACEFYFTSQAIADGREKSTLTKSENRQSEELYVQAVADVALSKIVREAITDGYREAYDGRPPSLAEIRAIAGRWLVPLVLTGLALGFAAGQMSASIASPGVKLAVLGSWLGMLVTGWWLGECFSIPKLNRTYLVHWLSFSALWIALHEILIARRWSGAHFISGLILDDLLAGTVFGLASAVFVSLCFHTMKKHDAEMKSTTEAASERGA